jgi:PTS system nitrogen regulatory IIA component
MQLTVREAAAYLRVDEATVRRWIQRRGLPVHRVNERLHLNAIEVWEWATENGVPVSRTLLEQAQRQPEQVPPLSELLSAGGIHHDIGGRDKASVLREIVQRLPLPADIDREFLATTLEAREAMGSTGIGDGIAIPHVRNPIVLCVRQPAATLCFLETPIDFGALDGQPVSILFTLVSPTVRAHLHLLSLISFALRDADFKSAVVSRAEGRKILEAAAKAEGRLTRASAPAGE